MKKQLFVMFASVSILLVILPIAAFAEADCFRGIKWGTDIATLKGMQYVKIENSFGGIKIYSRNDDELRIGGADLESIEYYFWQDKLCGVMVKFRGYSNFLSFKDATFEKFGAGHKTNQFMEDYSWLGEITNIILKYEEITEQGHLFMLSKEITEQQKKYSLEKAKRGAETGF